MLPQWVIEKKRNGNVLSDAEIHAFIQGYSSGEIPDYQMSALAMAIFFRGMTPEETASLTLAMMHSGEVIDPASLPGVKVDKHSTGGIGDKISLPLAPLAAACGVTVPMISGRGLGITGGTLDKLESISGYKTNLSIDQFRHILQTCGCSIIGQTPTLAPADKKLYALRDVTATVPSIPLITASIMSKKLAEGIDGLVLDVKFGKGAFMKTIAEARQLTTALVRVGRETGRQVTALLTDMNQPLGRTAGNALEISESIEILQGKGPEDIRTLTVELAAHMISMARSELTINDARALAERKLSDGSALEKWNEMVLLHGGDPDSALPAAAHKAPVISKQDGYVSAVDADKIGRAALLLGAGRAKTSDTIDHAAGLSDLVKIGEHVTCGQALCTLHTNREIALPKVHVLLSEAFTLSSTPTEAPPLVAEIISG